MENLYIEADHGKFYVPEVDFNAASGECWIKGESYLEEPFEFYNRLLKWLEEYVGIDNYKTVHLNLKYTYFNTSSSRAILELLLGVKDLIDNGKDLIVSWYYPDPDDDEMLLEAEDFADETDLDINMIEYKLKEA